ncbi:MAG: SDR family oxidoreductase [bacterium]
MERTNVFSESDAKGTALVTGGARRIGRAIALSLADKGYSIALHYHTSKAEAEDLASEIIGKGVECRLFRCDFNDPADVGSLIPSVFEHFPDCSLLINNASVFERVRLLDTDTDHFDRQFNVNFRTPFFLSRDFAKHCTEGQIINILDTKIMKMQIAYFAYTLSKKALSEFTLMAAKELGPRIRVNGISPGLILPSSEMSTEDFTRMGLRIPLGKTGNPANVVSAVHFLLENPFITGEIILVDGGEHLV